MDELPWTAPSRATLLVFLAVVAAVCAAFVQIAGRAAPAGAQRAWQGRAAFGLALWCALTAGVAGSGVLERGFPFVVAFLVTCNGLAIGLALSPFGRAVALATPFAWLIAFQAFRLPLEFVLHAWWEGGVIPQSMTWEGQNFDVASGATALVAAPLALWLRGGTGERIVSALFGVLGFALLMNVARVAVLSSPGPARVFGDPPLELAFHVPTVWIVPICVAGALFMHLVLFRKLLPAA